MKYLLVLILLVVLASPALSLPTPREERRSRGTRGPSSPSRSKRLVGGTEVPSPRYPCLVLLSDSNGDLWGTGTVIAKQMILTSADASDISPQYFASPILPPFHLGT